MRAVKRARPVVDEETGLLDDRGTHCARWLQMLDDEDAQEIIDDLAEIYAAYDRGDR